MLLTEGFAQSEAFFVQTLQLVGILFDTAHFQRPQRTYAGYLARTSGKLSNQGFLAKAPEAVVAKEKEKLATFEEKMKSLDERLQFLEKLG